MRLSPIERTFWLTAISITGAIAQPAWADQWTAALTPTTASAQNLNNSLEVYVTTVETTVNPANCAATDGYVVIDQTIAKESLAIALSAIVGSRHIELYLSSTQCAQNRPMVLDFTIS